MSEPILPSDPDDPWYGFAEALFEMLEGPFNNEDEDDDDT